MAPALARSGSHPRSDGIVSCVVDAHPRFTLELARWAGSLVDVAEVDPRDLVVNVVGAAESETFELLEKEGVVFTSIEVFDPASPHCNKIAGALSLATAHPDTPVALTDSDMVFLEDPRRSVPEGPAVAAKPVDAPLPPLDVLDSVFAAAGLVAPPRVRLPSGAGSTLRGNANGGLYAIGGGLLAPVAEAWSRWARWLLARPSLLSSWAIHVDQVAMCLALADAEVPTESLDVRWNMPVHDASRLPVDSPRPAGIHYHWRTDIDGALLGTGVPSIDDAIDEVNRGLRVRFPNGLPAGDLVAWRRSRATVPDGTAPSELHRVLRSLDTTSLLVVGSGGGLLDTVEALDRRDVRNVAELAQVPGRADLVVCNLGRGIDPPTASSELGALWERADRALVMVASGTDRSGSIPSPRVLLGSIAPGAEFYPLGGMGEAGTWVALRTPEGRHPRDFTAQTLAPLVDRHRHALDLFEIRVHARGALGFYPDHAPRLWEYPEVAVVLRDLVADGSRVADVGAGCSPLAPFLASRGYRVTTIDPSPRVRHLPVTPEWNEWDFFDFAAAGMASRSWNTTLDRVPPRPPFDAIYSVSVIEHLPARARRSVLEAMAKRLKPGGLAILTIDLERDSRTLWNRNLGETVEDPGVHGSLDDVIGEARDLHFEIVRTDVVRSWGDVDVDIGLLVLRRIAGGREAYGSLRSRSVRTVRKWRA